MMIHARVLILGLAFALTACTLPSEPPRGGLYEGLLPEGHELAPSSVSLPVVARNQVLGLIVSTSTERQLKFIEDYLSELKSSPTYVYRPDFDQALQPALLVEMMIAKFRQRFARVELLDDFREVARSGVDYLTVVDIGVLFPREFNYRFAYDLKAELLDRNLRRIGTFQGRGEESYYCIPIDCWFRANVIAQNRAVEDFDNALTDGLR